MPAQAGVEPKLAAAAERFGVRFRAVGPEGVHGAALAVRAPRIGLYKSWVPALDAVVLDTNGVPYTTLVNAEVKKGDLAARFDVIVLPDNSPGAILTGRGGGRPERLSYPPLPAEYQGRPGEDGAAVLKAFADVPRA